MLFWRFCATRKRQLSRVILAVVVILVFIPYLISTKTLSTATFDVEQPRRDLIDIDWRSNESKLAADITQVDRLLERVLKDVGETRQRLSPLYQRLQGTHLEPVQVQIETKSDTDNKSVLMNATTTGRNLEKERVAAKMSQHNLTLKPQFGREFLGCSDINTITIVRRLGKGTSKEVHLGKYRNRYVAIKRVTANVDDVRACLRRKKFWKESECYLYANYKIIKEILLRLQLQHPNILEMLGFCVRSEQTGSSLLDHGVISVTEVGELIKLPEVLKWDWNRRLKLAMEIANLLDYLEQSPLGSLIITDFKLDQMFFVDSKLKLGDLDDINNIEGVCNQDGQCTIDAKPVDIPCEDNKCKGINAKFNLLKFSESILLKILSQAPQHVKSEVTILKHQLGQLSINASELHEKLLAIQQRS